MPSFSIAFTTEKAMNIIYAACTENWSDIDAHLLIRELYERYRPLDTRGDASAFIMCEYEESYEPI
jgi:hypothetical protein